MLSRSAASPKLGVGVLTRPSPKLGVGVLTRPSPPSPRAWSLPRTTQAEVEPGSLRLRLLLLVNVLLQIGDGYATLMGLRRGMGEGNPLLVSLMDTIGTEPALLLTKLGALVGLGTLYACRRHPLVEPGLASLAVVYTALSIVPWTLLLVVL